MWIRIWKNHCLKEWKNSEIVKGAAKCRALILRLESKISIKKAGDRYSGNQGNLCNSFF